MKKVVIVLEPKKFNTKRDKLKEAELALEKEKKELENKNQEIDNSSVEVVKTENMEENLFEDMELSQENDGDTEIFKEEESKDEVINTISDVHDIFLDDDPDELGIELDTKEVFDDSSVKEVKELTEVKINATDPGNMTIPTEIFIEEPPVEKEVDLFKATDPFLDDNEFELEIGGSKDEIRSIMPMIGNIGTVRPNNALSKIEDVVKENNDIALPNLGLVDNTNENVPIVSENYIS